MNYLGVNYTLRAWVSSLVTRVYFNIHNTGAGKVKLDNLHKPFPPAAVENVWEEDWASSFLFSLKMEVTQYRAKGFSSAHPRHKSGWAQRTPGTLMQRKWTPSNKALLSLTSRGRKPQTPVLPGNKESLFSSPTPTPWSQSGPIGGWKAMYTLVTQMWEEENKTEGT